MANPTPPAIPIVAKTPKAPNDCANAKAEPAATDPIPAWIPAAVEAAATPAVVKPSPAIVPPTAAAAPLTALVIATVVSIFNYNYYYVSLIFYLNYQIVSFDYPIISDFSIYRKTYLL
jgi:hypothetical protein